MAKLSDQRKFEINQEFYRTMYGKGFDIATAIDLAVQAAIEDNIVASDEEANAFGGDFKADGSVPMTGSLKLGAGANAFLNPTPDQNILFNFADALAHQVGFTNGTVEANIWFDNNSFQLGTATPHELDFYTDNKVRVHISPAGLVSLVKDNDTNNIQIQFDSTNGRARFGKFIPAWVDGAEGNIINFGGDFNAGNEFRAIQLFSNNDQYSDINSYIWQGYNQYSLPAFAGPQLWIGNSSAHHMHFTTADQNRLSIDPQGRTTIGGDIFGMPGGTDIWFRANQADGGMVFSTSIAGNWLARFVNQGGPDFIRFGHDIGNDGDNVLVIQSDGSLRFGNGGNAPTLDPSLTTIFVNHADDDVRQICLKNNTTEAAIYLGNTANDFRLMLGTVSAGGGIQFFTQGFALTPFEIRSNGHITMGYDINAAFADKRATDAPGLSIKRVTDQTVNTFEVLDTDGVTQKLWIDKDYNLIIGTSPISYGFIGEHIAISSTSAETAFLARSEGSEMTVEMMMTAFGGPGASPKGGYVGTSTNSPVYVFSNNNNIAKFDDGGVKVGASADPSYAPTGKRVLISDQAEDVAFQLRAEGSQATVESTVGVWGGSGENALFIGTDSNHSNVLYTNGLTRLNIRENGQVIVGTDVQPGGTFVPLTSAVFSVVADSSESLDAFKVVDENNTDLMQIDKFGVINAVGYKAGGTPGIDHVEVINAKTFTWTKGLLTSVVP
jgi:hypothetical protein